MGCGDAADGVAVHHVDQAEVGDLFDQQLGEPRIRARIVELDREERARPGHQGEPEGGGLFGRGPSGLLLLDEPRPIQHLSGDPRHCSQHSTSSMSSAQGSSNPRNRCPARRPFKTSGMTTAAGSGGNRWSIGEVATWLGSDSPPTKTTPRAATDEPSDPRSSASITRNGSICAS